MNVKGLVFLLVGCLFLFPIALQAQSVKEESRLVCNVAFRILEMKNDVVFNSNVLGEFGFDRKISRLTVQVVKIDASEKDRAEAPLAFKWLQANAKELDFKSIFLGKDERNKLRNAYKANKETVFTSKIEVAVLKEDGQFVGFAHLLGKLDGTIEWKR